MANNTSDLAWESALTLPGRSSLFDSLISELAEYLGLSKEEVTSASHEGGRLVAEAWEASGLTESNETAKIENFYRVNKAYLFDLTEFNARYPYVQELQSVAKFARKRGFRRALDFGSGIGSIGIFLARSGMEVTLADVSEPLLAYAKWRFAKHGLSARFIDLNTETLPDERFDLVTTLDVLEHVANPEKIIQQIGRSMTWGGILAFNVGPLDPRFPQHISSFDDVLSIIRSCGFHRDEQALSFELFKKVHRSVLFKTLHRTLDPIWYKGLRRPLVAATERAGLKEAVKRLLGK